MLIKSWKEVKKYLNDLIEAQPVSNFEVVARSGLSRDSYYKIFSPEREDSPMRSTTVYGLANALDLSVEYVDNFPQFEQKGKGDSLRISRKHAHEAFEKAVEIAGSIEYLSELTDIPLDTLKELAMPIAIMRGGISRILFLRMGMALGRAILLHPNGKIEFISDDIKENILAGYSAPEIQASDVGLLQLLEEENTIEYKISESEIIELTMISQNRKSQTTIEQWISILYTLRALEQK